MTSYGNFGQEVDWKVYLAATHERAVLAVHVNKAEMKCSEECHGGRGSATAAGRFTATV
ncbi:MAG: hypothetical protein IPJ98_28610 [Bryobacterales bacterium]|nr:hypothetical protein [Bryobacterales bacterium]